MKFQSKLIALITVYIITLVIVITAYYAREQRNNSLRNLQERSVALVKILSISSSTQLFWSNYDKLNQYAQKIKESFPINYVAIVDYDGDIMAHTNRSRLGLKLAPSEGFDVLSSDDILYVYRESPISSFTISYPIFILNKVVGYIIMEHDTKTIENEIYNAYLTSFFLAIGLMLIGIILAVYSGQRITRPVRKVMIGMDRIASGDYDHKIMVGDDTLEFRKLAHAFNNMGHQLKSSVKKLDEEKSQSEAIITSISDGLMLIDTTRKVRFLNKGAEGILGYTSEEAHDKICYEVFNSPSCSKETCSLYAANGSGNFMSRCVKSDARIHITDKAGHKKIILKSASTLVNTQGEIYGGVEVFKDITSLLTMESKLKQADRLSSLGILAAGMAHEINNPISCIVGLANVLLRDADDDPVIREDLTMIKEQGERCGNIIKNLMNLAINVPKEMKPVELNAILKTTARLITKSAPDNKMLIKENYDKHNPVIRADEGQLMQVFTNIIKNAVAATKSSGMLEISTRMQGHTVEIIFEDNGEGISSANMNRIFDPFFTTKSVGEGMGLGLAVSHGIITSHGGEIKIESKEGEGAKFIIEMYTISSDMDKDILGNIMESRKAAS